YGHGGVVRQVGAVLLHPDRDPDGGTRSGDRAHPDLAHPRGAGEPDGQIPPRPPRRHRLGQTPPQPSPPPSIELRAIWEAKTPAPLIPSSNNSRRTYCRARSRAPLATTRPEKTPPLENAAVFCGAGVFACASGRSPLELAGENACPTYSVFE